MIKDGNMNRKCKIITAFCAVGITAAALLEGKTPSQWLHDIAMESIGADKTDE